MSQKNKKRGKNTKSKIEGQKRDILFAEAEQTYAVVEKMLGNCRLQAKCSDGKTRLCHIRGKMKRRVWIREGSVILIGMREFEDDKADVIHCYTADEARKLISYGEITNDKQSNNDNVENDIMWEDGNIEVENDTSHPNTDNKKNQNKSVQENNSELTKNIDNDIECL